MPTGALKARLVGPTASVAGNAGAVRKTLIAIVVVPVRAVLSVAVSVIVCVPSINVDALTDKELPVPRGPLRLEFQLKRELSNIPSSISAAMPFRVIVWSPT